jgi:hypothetical protein
MQGGRRRTVTDVQMARRGEVGLRTQSTRNHRSAVILVGGISVAAAVPERR